MTNNVHDREISSEPPGMATSWSKSVPSAVGFVITVSVTCPVSDPRWRALKTRPRPGKTCWYYVFVNYIFLFCIDIIFNPKYLPFFVRYFSSQNIVFFLNDILTPKISYFFCMIWKSEKKTSGCSRHTGSRWLGCVQCSYDHPRSPGCFYGLWRLHALWGWHYSSSIHNYCAKRFLRSYGASKLEFRPSVCPENNWILQRVYEPTTHASVYWDFENTILKVPEKKLQKLKLSFNTGMFGINFWTCFGDTFLKK